MIYARFTRRLSNGHSLYRALMSSRFTHAIGDDATIGRRYSAARSFPQAVGDWTYQYFACRCPDGVGEVRESLSIRESISDREFDTSSKGMTRAAMLQHGRKL